MEKIIKYLESKKRNYDKGLILLAKFSKNRMLLQNLARKPRPEKLQYELQKLVDRATPVVVEDNDDQDLDDGVKDIVVVKTVDITAAPSESEEVIPVIEKPNRLVVLRNKQEIDYKDLPKPLQILWDDNAELYKHSRSLHEKLKLMEKASPDERKPIIEKLVSMQASVRDNWNYIDAYDPAAVVKKAEPKTIDAKRISANRKYISFNVKKLSPGDNDSKLFVKIQERITELITANETFKQDQHDKLVKLGFLLQTTSE